MIKSIWVSDDESILYTGGCDGTMRLWDIGTRSVIQTYGEQKNRRQADDLVDEFQQYHTDSITHLQPSSLGGKPQNGSSILSAGRDGSICEMDILTREATKIYQQKQPITCVTADNRNGFIWYGTASSTFNCFAMPNGGQSLNESRLVNEAFGDAQERLDAKSIVKDEQVMSHKGQPRIMDKHLMNNKRFVLTVNEDKLP